MPRAVLIGVTVAAFLTSVTSAFADGPVQPVAGSRTLVVRDLRLPADEWIAVSLHPSERPIELRASTRDLEACPASYDGNLPEAGAGSSWPSFAGFTGCIPFDADGRVTLPSTVVNTFHLAFLVRAQDHAAVSVEQLAVSYEPEDGYFKLRTPPITPGRRSPRVLMTPTQRATVSVAAGASDDEVSAPTLTVAVRQSGTRLHAAPVDASPSQRGFPTYGPVTLDKPVSLRIRNRGKAPTSAFVWLDWS